jgi:hypothetical protein
VTNYEVLKYYSFWSGRHILSVGEHFRGRFDFRVLWWGGGYDGYGVLGCNTVVLEEHVAAVFSIEE